MSPRFLTTLIQHLWNRARQSKRFQLWGGVVAVALIAFVFYSHWERSKLLSSQKQEQEDTQVGAVSLDQLEWGDNSLLQTEEDRAIGADIDTLPLLLNDFKPPNAAPEAAPEASPSESSVKSNNNRPQLQPLLPQGSNPPLLPLDGSTAIPAANEGLPSSTTENPIPSSNFLEGDRPSAPALPRPPYFSTSYNFPSPPGRTAVLANPLQDALQRNSAQPSMTNSSSTAVGSFGGFTTVSPSTEGTASNTTTLQPPTPALQGVQNENVDSTPSLQPTLYPQSRLQSSPPIGTTGYTLPPSLRSPSNEEPVQ